MLDNQNPMDERLREKFESFEMIPPDTAWEGIRTSLKSRVGITSILSFVPAILFLAFFTIYVCSGENQLPSRNTSISASADLPSIDKSKVEENEELNLQTTNDQQSSETNSSIQTNDEVNSLLDTQTNSSERVRKTTGKRKQKEIAELGEKSQEKPKVKIAGQGQFVDSTSISVETSGESPTASRYLNKDEQNYPYSDLLVLPKKGLTGYYFINSANPTKFPFAPVAQRRQSSHPLDRFSIDGGVGVSTFRINVMDKNNPALKSIVEGWNSGEVGFGAQLGINYAFRGNYSVSAGIEVVSQRNKLIGKTIETQTNHWSDTIDYMVDTIFNMQDSTWYLDTTWNVSTTEYETVSVSEANSSTRSTMLIIPFSFSFRKSLGVRSALEFNLGGSLGIYQQGSGQVIVNSSGNVVAIENAYRKKGQLMVNASVKYLYQMTLKQAVYVEPRIGIGMNNFYQPSFQYQSRISQFGIKVGYRFYL